MPWKEESIVEQRLRFILQVREEGMSVAAACREANISRTTGYKWLNRYDEEGLGGLEDRSSAPKTIPHKTDEKTEEMICMLRGQYPLLGPKKLRAWLMREHPDADWPAASTIGDILARNDLIEEQSTTRKTPPATKPLAEADGPNRIWSADFKGQFQLGDGTMCYPLTVTDNYSRMVLGCQALRSVKTQPVKERFKQVFESYGLPDAIRTDNGAPFASVAPRGLSRLSAWWHWLGIEHERIEPGKPQQNGRHERMHLTLKNHSARPAAETLMQQQTKFDEFCTFFNELRPHEAHDQNTPASCYQQSNIEYSENGNGPDYSLCDLMCRVTDCGQICVGSDTIYLTQALAGYQVGLIEMDLDVWVVHFAGTDIGLFEPGDRSISALDKPKSVRQPSL